jgi:hypothetical protein
MPLDPIVSLSVALAEAPGTCAFFLGSGVSRDANVPTGWEILRHGLQRLYQLETSSEAPVDDDRLDSWLAKTGKQDITYAQLLELLAPDLATRREYLAGFFEGSQPGMSHERLADLASRGLARVFVTTNFDRLLEHALQARGIEPVVVASDADLHDAPPREHAHVFVLKPHGDYLRQTIRNTPSELAELDPGIGGELAAIFDRHGLVVVGYSGSDEAIARAMLARRSRYGMWWVSRGAPQASAAALIDATYARVIRRDTATEFLSDLDRRLRVFEQHPSGLTPATLHDEVLALVRADDTVGLHELLRRERHEFSTALERVRTDARSLGPARRDTVTEAWQQLAPVLERRLSTLLPLLLHRHERFAEEISALAALLENLPPAAGYTVWAELPEFATTWIGYHLGAAVIRLRRLEGLLPLVSTTWTESRYGTVQSVVQLAGTTSAEFGGELAPPGNWVAPQWEFLTASTREFGWLLERYPELVDEHEPRRSMGAFDLLFATYLGLRGMQAISWWLLSDTDDFALRLHRNTSERAQVADAFGLTLDEFDRTAPDAIRSARTVGDPFRRPAATASLLETGTRS